MTLVLHRKLGCGNRDPYNNPRNDFRRITWQNSSGRENSWRENTWSIPCEIWSPRLLLSSWGSIGEKLAEFRTSHPLQTARTLLNAEIKLQFPADMSRNVFNKKKRSAINIYKIFSTEGLERDDIRWIRKISPSTFGRFKEKTMKVILERIRTTFSRPSGLEGLLDDLDLDLNEEGKPMLTDE